LNSLLSSGKSHLLAAAIGVGTALLALAPRYPASSVPMTTATILLFCVVLAYVQSSHENIKLLWEQLARQELVFVEFGLKFDEVNSISVWAANLGTSSFLVTEIEVRTHERSASQRSQVNIVVPAGKLESKMPFDDRIFETLRSDAFVHFDISLRCRGLAENHQTPWKAFTVQRRPQMALQDSGVWPVRNVRASILWACGLKVCRIWIRPGGDKPSSRMICRRLVPTTIQRYSCQPRAR
jgi:hypothetical protein